MNLIERTKKLSSEQIEAVLILLAKIPYTFTEERQKRFDVWHSLCVEYRKRHGDDEMDKLLDKLDSIICEVNNLEVPND